MHNTLNLVLAISAHLQFSRSFLWDYPSISYYFAKKWKITILHYTLLLHKKQCNQYGIACLMTSKMKQFLDY